MGAPRAAAGTQGALAPESSTILSAVLPLSLVCQHHLAVKGVRNCIIMSKATDGILIESDEPTIVLLQHLHEKGPTKFILRSLDTRHLFIKKDIEVVRLIKRKLAERLEETTFDEDELAVAMQAASAAAAKRAGGGK